MFLTNCSVSNCCVLVKPLASIFAFVDPVPINRIMRCKHKNVFRSCRKGPALCLKFCFTPTINGNLFVCELTQVYVIAKLNQWAVVVIVTTFQMEATVKTKCFQYYHKDRVGSDMKNKKLPLT